MKFRKKPIVIEATQWLKHGDHPEVSQSFDQVHGNVERICTTCGCFSGAHSHVKTLEGGHNVCPGDWIITGIKGEHYPCKPDIFAATYEAVEE